MDVKVGDFIIIVQYNGQGSSGIYRGESKTFPNKVILEVEDLKIKKNYHYLIDSKDIRVVKIPYKNIT